MNPIRYLTRRGLPVAQVGSRSPSAHPPFYWIDRITCGAARRGAVPIRFSAKSSPIPNYGVGTIVGVEADDEGPARSVVSTAAAHKICRRLCPNWKQMYKRPLLPPLRLSMYSEAARTHNSVQRIRLERTSSAGVTLYVQASTKLLVGFLRTLKSIKKSFGWLRSPRVELSGDRLEFPHHRHSIAASKFRSQTVSERASDGILDLPSASFGEDWLRQTRDCSLVRLVAMSEEFVPSATLRDARSRCRPARTVHVRPWANSCRDHRLGYDH